MSTQLDEQRQQAHEQDHIDTQRELERYEQEPVRAPCRRCYLINKVH